MEQTTEEVRYAGVGSQSDLGSNKGLQAKGVVRDNKFQLLAGSIIAPAAPALNKKYAELRAVHLEQGHIVASGGGCFRVQRDLPFKSASQAFIYAYGTNPPGGKLTWTPPSGPGRVVRKHTAAGATTDAGAAEHAVMTPIPKEPAIKEVAMMDDEDLDEDEVDLPPPSPSYAGKKENEDDEDEEDDEVEAELAYIEAKIRMLQIRKSKLLGQKGKTAKPRARNLKLEKGA